MSEHAAQTMPQQLPTQSMSAAAPPAVAPSPTGSSDSASSGPAKGLLLRIKRKRTDAPLTTLLVASERSEKRAALHDLRTSMEATKLATGAAAGAAADNATAFSAAPASSSAAAGPVTSPIPLRSRPRVFRLLTSTSAPKEAHASEPSIAARIAALRGRAGGSAAAAAASSGTVAPPALPSAVPSSADVHEAHLAAQVLSSEQKREIRLQHSRDRLARLGQAVPQPPQQLVHDSESLQVKIVDVALPGQEGYSKDRATLQPPPLSDAERKRRAEQKARAREEQAMSSSHRSRVGGIDPHEAAAQFQRAMGAIRRMPNTGRAQMEAYKGLLEDYLATLPPTPESEATAQRERERQRAQAAAAAAGSTSTASAAASAESEVAEGDSFVPPQSPRQTGVAPKIPLRRRKKPTTAAPTSSADASSSSAAVAAVPTNVPLSFISTPEHPLPERIMQPAGEIHPQTGAQRLQSAAASASPDESKDEDDYVYDVYEQAEEASVEDVLAAAAGGDKSAAASSASGALAGSVDWHSRYGPRSGAAYVVLRDGVLEWVGGPEDELVNEADDADAVDDPTWEDDEASEMSDYPDDESDASDEFGFGGREDNVLDEVDDTNYRDPLYNGTHPSATRVWRTPSYHPHHAEHSLAHMRAQPARHGFLQEADEADEALEEEDIVNEVRRSMAAGRYSTLSSSDDEACAHPHPQFRGLDADDEEYVDQLDEEDDEDEPIDEDED